MDPTQQMIHFDHEFSAWFDRSTISLKTIHSANPGIEVDLPFLCCQLAVLLAYLTAFLL
jgi:hypothetical protein